MPSKLSKTPSKNMCLCVCNQCSTDMPPWLQRQYSPSKFTISDSLDTDFTLHLYDVLDSREFDSFQLILCSGALLEGSTLLKQLCRPLERTNVVCSVRREEDRSLLGHGVDWDKRQEARQMDGGQERSLVFYANLEGAYGRSGPKLRYGNTINRLRFQVRSHGCSALFNRAHRHEKLQSISSIISPN